MRTVSPTSRNVPPPRYEGRRPFRSGRLGTGLAIACVCTALGACAATPPAERRVPVTAENLPDVQKAGYTIVNRDGRKLYCRRERLTGSHARFETSCLTAEELEALKDSTQRGLESMRRTRPPRQDGG